MKIVIVADYMIKIMKIKIFNKKIMLQKRISDNNNKIDKCLIFNKNKMKKF